MSSVLKANYSPNTNRDVPEPHHIIEIQTTRPRIKSKRKPSIRTSKLTGKRKTKIPISVLASNSTLSMPPDESSSSTPLNSEISNVKLIENKESQIIEFKTEVTKITTPKRVATKSKGLLTREDEANFSFAIRSLRKAIKIRDELALRHRTEDTEIKSNSETEVSEKEWAEACGISVLDLKRVMLAGQDARAQLVTRNTGLVVQIAKRYHSRSNDNSILTLQDMIQEGNLGLMEAAERFDPKRGFKFGTYAAWWVRQRILRSIADHSRVIRLPVHGECFCNDIQGAIITYSSFNVVFFVLQKSCSPPFFNFFLIVQFILFSSYYA